MEKKKKTFNKDGSPRSNLPKHMLGQFKNPEVKRKAEDKLRESIAEKKRKRAVVEQAFGDSKLADPANQAKLLDRLYEWALSDDIEIAMKAMKQLNDLKAITQVAEKPVEIVEEKVEENAEEAVEFLKKQSKQ